VEIEKTPWSESASELYRPSDRSLSAKWLPTFVDKGCHVVSVTDPYGRILGFLDRSRYFFHVAPQLYSRGWVDPVPDPLLFFSISAENRTRASGSAELEYLSKKTIPVTGRGGLLGYEMLRIPHCLDNRLTDGSKVVSPTHWPHFTPQKHYFSASGTHFC
jgi:hypothetical protein